MGHARNYLTQDIIRRILRDYFSYDIHFVMNVTDVDDKIILRARHQYLLSNYKNKNVALSDDFINDFNKAFAKFVNKVKGVFGEDGSDEDYVKIVERILNKSIDDNVTKIWLENNEKSSMYLQLLKDGLECFKSLKNGDAIVSEIIDKCSDIFSSYLDDLHGHTVTNPSIYRSLAAYWENEFFKDMEKLNIEKPDTLTRVSEYVPEIIKFIQKIIDNGYGYTCADGSVYFNTHKFDNDDKGEFNHIYAKLQPYSKGSKELIEEGEGSLSNKENVKKSSSDFALWKASKSGEPYWPSPWGNGRPGWHIECSVMASEVLGNNIDIHSGGIDLKFPHHDNELAQSEACHNCQNWINYFLHTGHLHIEGQKMSKSLKNFITIHQALDRYSARQLRLGFMLQLWNQSMDFKESSMNEVKNYEKMLINFFNNVKAIKLQSMDDEWDGNHYFNTSEKDLDFKLKVGKAKVRESLCDSFNTPLTLQYLSDLVAQSNVYINDRKSHNERINVGVLENVAKYITKMLNIFGVIKPSELLEIGWKENDNESDNGNVDKESLIFPYVKTLSSFRDQIRQLAINKDSSKSDILNLCDNIRDQDLVELGVSLDDQPSGKALVKLVSPTELKRIRDLKIKQQNDKILRSKAVKEKEEQKKLEKLKKGSIPSNELFKINNNNEYSQFDNDGIPTHDNQGLELAKKRRKNLQKEYEIQLKLHKEWVDAGSPKF